MNRKYIKVCGMREPDNIRAVEALGVDWMGFIFWPGSSRYVGTRPDYLPTRAKRVGVFVDADTDDIVAHIADYRLDAVQLHGNETPASISLLRTSLTGAAAGVAIIKTFSIATPDDLARTTDYEGAADYFLFDTKTPLVGGSGRQFDWTILTSYHGTTPFLLSGGIGPHDAARVNAFHHPQCIGIDLNSRFECAPALKDIQKLKAFLYEQQNQQPLR